MRQSTLLFGGAAERLKSVDTDSGPERSSSLQSDAGPQRAKRARRAAAGKGQEKSRQPMQQMTFGQNGQLHRYSPESSRSSSSEIMEIVGEEDTVQPDLPSTSNKKEKKREETETPLNLSVKGTQSEFEAVHSFFAKRKIPTVAPGGNRSKTAVSDAPKAPKTKRSQQVEAPWPDYRNAHVQPNDEYFYTSFLPSASVNDSLKVRTEQRKPGRKLGNEECLYPWASTSKQILRATIDTTSIRRVERPDLTLIAENVNLQACMTNSHLPASIQRLHDASLKGSATSNELWIDRWRPVRAAEVLGNEAQSLSLSRWLAELQVKVTTSDTQRARAVERKKKKRPGLTGFNVQDDEAEDAWFDQFRRPTNEDLSAKGCDSTEDGDNKAEEALMNATVLCGPTGSGKTAAVYACAAEHGFEVFELYPGNGRRSGKDIGQAVGDLGRNHMVSSGGTGGGATWKSAKAATGVPGAASGSAQRIRQSLILLEEVDVLYEEDKGFWPAVIELVSVSRRPVIMTCTDTSCIPIELLPIQEVLIFEPPDEQQATVYLQLMALCSGHLLGASLVTKLYSSTAGDFETQWGISRLSIPADGPLHPKTSSASVDKSRGMASSCDLRQAIMQLQFLCQQPATLREDSSDKISPGDGFVRHSWTLRWETTRCERYSYYDALLKTPFSRASEILEPDNYLKSLDDMQGQGVVHLLKPMPAAQATSLASIGREHEYEESLFSPSIGMGHDWRQSFDCKRIETSGTVADLLRGVSINPSCQIPNCAAVEDYAPLVSNMIRVDDAEESLYQVRLAQVVQEVQQQLQSGNGRSLPDTASVSLLQMGIRPSRQATKLILEKGSDGLLALSRHETAPCRWIELDHRCLQALRESWLTVSV